MGFHWRTVWVNFWLMRRAAPSWWLLSLRPDLIHVTTSPNIPIPVHLTSLTANRDRLYVQFHLVYCLRWSTVLVQCSHIPATHVLFRCQEIHYRAVVVLDVWPVSLLLPVEVLFIVVVSVAYVFLFGMVAVPSLNPPPFSSGLGTCNGGVSPWIKYFNSLRRLGFSKIKMYWNKLCLLWKK